MKCKDFLNYGLSVLLLVVGSSLMCSCGEDGDKSKPRYVFEDTKGVMHLHPRCSCIAEWEDKSLNEIVLEKNKAIIYHCMSEDYDMGSYEEFAAKIEDEDSRRKIYDALSGDYSDLGSFEEFSKKLVGEDTTSVYAKETQKGHYVLVLYFDDAYNNYIVHNKPFCHKCVSTRDKNTMEKAAKAAL